MAVVFLRDCLLVGALVYAMVLFAGRFALAFGMVSDEEAWKRECWDPGGRGMWEIEKKEKRTEEKDGF